MFILHEEKSNKISIMDHKISLKETLNLPKVTIKENDNQPLHVIDIAYNEKESVVGRT